jgi:hypothetical protein
METRSWYAVVTAKEGCWLPGATKVHCSSRFSHREDAEHAAGIYLSVCMSGKESLVGDSSVRGSSLPPHIARCCKGYPAQVVGYPCFGCGKTVGPKKTSS